MAIIEDPVRLPPEVGWICANTSKAVSSLEYDELVQVRTQWMPQHAEYALYLRVVGMYRSHNTCQVTHKIPMGIFSNEAHVNIYLGVLIEETVKALAEDTRRRNADYEQEVPETYDTPFDPRYTD